MARFLTLSRQNANIVTESSFAYNRGSVDTRIDKRDLPWIALIAVSFVFGLAVSWERWGNPLVDCGREMNQPLRLAQGELLYSDVRHIYGPLSPYVNALLYRIFGASLGVLYADGIFTAAVILALVYWISRKLMGRVPAAAATLSVTWLCAFKQAGNYVLPYSYSALHGCALGLASLALLLRFIELRAEENHARASRIDWALVLAGFAAGLTMLAKTEMGLAALGAGVIAVALAGQLSFRRVFIFGAMFVTPALALVLGAYGYIAAHTGWSTLAEDSLIFLRNLPPELVYFNKRVSGFDQPLQSIAQMISAAVRIAALAAIIAAVSHLLARRKTGVAPSRVPISDLQMSDAGAASYGQIWLLLAASLLVFLLIPLAGALNWEKGPYLAMPVVLAVLIAVELVRHRKLMFKRALSARTIIFLTVAAYALVSLARVILRVRSGGAYSSYLLPASVIVFTYAWAHPFAEMFRDGNTRRIARNIALALILADVLATAGLLTVRYREKNYYTLQTERGTMVCVPDLGQSMSEAIAFIERETAPGDSIAVMPEGTSLNFFTGRPNPLREEITTPGYLDLEGEKRAIKQLEQSNTQFVLVSNRATPEFGARVFGRDYCQTLMQWIEENFEACGVFGPDHNPNQEIGDKTFFIRAYRKRSSQQPGLISLNTK